MRRWWAAGLATAMVLLLVPVPPPASARPTPPAEELDTARRDLEVAERSLADVEAELRRARDAVDAVEARLDAAAAELHAVTAELTAAERVLRAKQDAERAAAAELVSALAAMDARLAEWDDTRRDVEARIAATYKHGAATPATLLLEGVARSADLHEAAVAVRTVHGVMHRDRQLLRRNRDLTRAANAVRAEVAALRATARTEERAAARERRRVGALVERQARLVTAIAADRDERARIVARIEDDRAAKAVLVQQLARRVRELSVRLDEVLLAAVDLPLDGPPPAWASALPARGRRWAATIDAVGAGVGLDGRLLAALVWTESNFTPTAVSSAGAVGLAQLMPGTARGLGVDPWDPVQNLTGGARYLRAQIVRFGAVELGLAAYNAGPGAVQRHGGVPDYAETQMYVLRVLERYERIRAAG